MPKIKRLIELLRKPSVIKPAEEVIKTEQEIITESYLHRKPCAYCTSSDHTAWTHKDKEWCDICNKRH